MGYWRGLRLYKRVYGIENFGRCVGEVTRVSPGQGRGKGVFSTPHGVLCNLHKKLSNIVILVSIFCVVFTIKKTFVIFGICRIMGVGVLYPKIKYRFFKKTKGR